MQATEKPWLILTLRRTGGTSLTTFLSKTSTFPSIQHEPFNVDRLLGQITRDFRETGDVAAMEAAVEAALTDNPNIKHCVEIIPLEITRALIDACVARGYGFAVLTRRDEGKRILSLLLAVSTGAWGPEMAADIYPKIVAGTLMPKPIELKSVSSRVTQDYFSIGKTLSLLRNRRLDYQWLLFEELYFGEVPIEDQAREIAGKLGIEIAADDPRLAAFSERDGQKSASIASHVEGYDAAADLVKTLCTI